MNTKKAQKRIFLDYASATPVDQRVLKEVQNAQKKFWSNPSSLHFEGQSAKAILESARIRIARALHCRAEEIYFTSGGTESLNIVTLGVIASAKARGVVGHIIVSTIEHPAVLNPIKQLVKNGEAEATFIAPDEKGIINPETVRREIRGNTVLVAIQHANNEIGTIQPIREISKIIRNFNSPPYLLVDASQSALYENISVERLGADIMILDGIKIYGPRGSGMLFVKRGVEIMPSNFGGGQEGGLRPGTENVSAALGFALALEIAQEKREKESMRLANLRDYAIGRILDEIPGASLNGSRESRLPNNINICFKGADSEFLVIKLDTLGFAVSAASACHSLSLENSSYVIESLGGKQCASSSLRFTFGRDTKKPDLDKLISALKRIIK
jgi:cysteine desulfurase